MTAELRVLRWSKRRIATRYKKESKESPWQMRSFEGSLFVVALSGVPAVFHVFGFQGIITLYRLLICLTRTVLYNASKTQ